MAGQPTNRRGASTIALANSVLAILALTIAVVWTYAMFIERPRRNPLYRAAVVEQVRERLRERTGKITAEAKTVAEEILPPLREAVVDQARREYPGYFGKLRSEGFLFVGNVEEAFVSDVKAHYRERLRKQRPILADELPNASPEQIDRLLAQLEQTSDRLVERYYLEEFRKEMEQTSINWHQVEPLPPPAAGEPAAGQQLVETFADWTVLSFAEEAP